MSSSLHELFCFCSSQFRFVGCSCKYAFKQASRRLASHRRDQPATRAAMGGDKRQRSGGGGGGTTDRQAKRRRYAAAAKQSKSRTGAGEIRGPGLWLSCVRKKEAITTSEAYDLLNDVSVAWLASLECRVLLLLDAVRGKKVMLSTISFFCRWQTGSILRHRSRRQRAAARTWSSRTLLKTSKKMISRLKSRKSSKTCSRQWILRLARRRCGSRAQGQTRSAVSQMRPIVSSQY